MTSDKRCPLPDERWVSPLDVVRGIRDILSATGDEARAARYLSAAMNMSERRAATEAAKAARQEERERIVEWHHQQADDDYKRNRPSRRRREFHNQAAKAIHALDDMEP